MNEISDYGRPAYFIPVDRNGRELPLRPCVVGKRPPSKQDLPVTHTGPKPLQLVIGHSQKSARMGAK